MPLELGNDPNQHWYFFENNEFKPIFLFCPWALETPTEQLKVIITRIDFTLKRQFRLRLQIYPEGEPSFSNFFYIDKIPRTFCLSDWPFSTLSRISRTRISWSGLDSSQFTPNWPSGESIFLDKPNWILNIKSRLHLTLKKIESSITHLDDLPEEECNRIPLNCIWPITSQDTNQTVIITCLKKTFNFELCVRVTAYPLGAPSISKQIGLDDHHPLLRSLTDALHLYEAFPEPHLNSHPLEHLEELIEYLHFKF